MNPLIILLPILLGGILSLASQKYSRFIALAGSVLSSIVIIFVLLGSSFSFASAYTAALPTYSLNWFSLSTLSVSLYLSTMSINELLLILVGIISPLIFWYSIGYMDVPSENSRYYFELSVFAASMLLFAMSADFITMFIAWEGLGITSYLLIGFWYNKREPPYAARKAITTIIIGDILMLSGILIIWTSFHTFVFSTLINSQATQSTNFAIALLLILFASFTKSAQFPFHEWLSDAMEGPTPVSAFLHSSTMVKAGVFLIALLLPLYISAHLLPVILVFGIITAIFGVINAVSSKHIKKILAYSTIEDLGLMFVALGLGAILAALLLFIVQTFYKALMFMNAGSIMKANDEETNIYKIYSFGGNKTLLAAAVIGSLSLAGVFPFSGFLGKAAIDTSASSNIMVYLILVALDFLTAFYIFRWLFVPMKQQKSNPRDSRIGTNFAYAKKSMIVPQLILSVIVIGVSLFAFYMNSISQYITTTDLIIESAVSIAGVAVALFVFYIPKRALFSERSAARNFLSKGLFVNAAYYYIARFVQLVAHAIDIFDYELNRFFYSGARGTTDLGNAIRKTESGSVNLYLTAFAVGLIFIILILVL